MKDTASELITLNERIRAGAIFYDSHTGKNDSEDLYRNFEHFGFSRADVMVVTICPDGDDTIIGNFVTRDGKFYSFDFDLDDLRYSNLDHSKLLPRQSRLYSESITEAAARWFKD
ncbi:hypothetical protein [Sphingomonas sp.]|uniref:hypothetical protein n=1 Tax=Sphingomonas sp. TaxID=28214 RepID=UPI003D6D1F43